MIPGARVQATIELLDEIAGTRTPADHLVGNYFRSRRYAGSKDRRAVSEMVYSILRRRGEYAWRSGGEDSRHLILAHLMAEGGGEHDAVAGLFSGEKFCPTGLEDDEQKSLAKLAQPDADDVPAWVTGNYPEWLQESLQRRFGADLAVEMAAMLGRAEVDLRVNDLQSNMERVMAVLEKEEIPVTPGALAPTALRLDSRRSLTNHPLYQSGSIEIQDEGSQLVSLLCTAQPGQMVVDYCAGAGGKSLAMAAKMANKGQIFALDKNPRRLRPLRDRLQRAGARNIQVHALADPAAKAVLAEQIGKTDRVLLDVPCSGSGAWRRNPESKWRFSEEEFAGYCVTQGEILRQSAPLVKPGGRLIYATCSILMEENEDQIESFLGEHPEFEIVPIGEVWDEVMETPCPAEDDYLRLTPAQNSTDGFFVAVLQRREAG